MTQLAVNPSNLPLPPGDFGLPWLGEPPRLFDLEYMMEQYRKHGPVFKTRILGRKIAVFMGPEANRFILSTGMKHFSWRDGWLPTFKELLGESLFVQDGEEHRAKRRLIMPAFHRQALHNYMETMEDITLRNLDRWEKLRTFQWADENKHLTFEIASKLLTGTDAGEESAQLSRLFTQMTKGFVNVPLRWSWTPYGKALRARDALLEYIEKAVIYRQQNPTHDALGLMIQTRDEDGVQLTMDELKTQTLLMLFAGHETSASMMTSLMMLLAQHPDILQKARDEQDNLRIDGRLSMDNIKSMTYLEQVLKEVERMRPPVPAGFRGVIEPIEFNGYYIPEGWTALYWINVTHRDPAVYRDPDTFDPDRFSPERNENSVPFSLVGFGGGSRVCIGYAFAQLEMKIVASYLLRHYAWDILPDQNLNSRYNPTIFPKDGLRVVFRKRGA